MITLLSKLFIKNNKNYQDSIVRRAYGVLCSIMGIVLNVMLFLAKLVIGVITASVSIMADSFNNLSDAGASLLALLGFKLSARKPSDALPFGQGRFEYITSLLISAVIFMLGFTLLKEAITAIIESSVSQFSIIAVVILSASIIIKLYMALYNRLVGKKIDSSAMKAVAIDSIGDVISTATVLLCSILHYYTGVCLDGWCGALVSILIIFAGIKSAKGTVADLLGKRPEPEFVEKIYSIVMKYDEIIGIHDLVVHDYGPGKIMISLHAEVVGDIDIYLLHDAIDRAMIELDQTLNCVSIIHMDPISINDGKTLETKQKTEKIVKLLDERITIHDFRMVEGPTHTNLIFDAVIPHDLKITDDEAKEALNKLISDNFKNTYAVIQIDKSYV